MSFKKYYCVRQHYGVDCAAACLATISKQYGLEMTISKIREIAGTDNKKGTNIYGIIKAAEQMGFTAKAVKGGRDGFFSEFPLPCIAHVIVKGRFLHYVVVHKITKKRIILADPNKGVIGLRPEIFLGENSDEEKPSNYRWSGVFVLLIPEYTFNREK